MIARSRRSRAVAAVLTAVAISATACSFGPPDPDTAGAPPNLPTPSASAATQDDTGQEVVATVLATKLEVPWGIAFLPDGGALVTERDTARIVKVGPRSDAEGLVVTEVQRLTEVEQGGDGGLLGIAVSPRHAVDRTVYVYYTTARDNRVAKLVLGGRPQPILTGIPRAERYNGGALAFGPDGHLYVGTGDGTRGSHAQNPRSLGGKILRITPAGRPAPGNPVGTSPVWSFGHRDVLGLAWDATKKLYASEAGQRSAGELNVVTRGGNHGWPKVEANSPNRRYRPPLAWWPTAESECAGVAVLERTVATACLLGRRLWLVSTTTGGTLLGQPQAALADEYGRLRALATAPDGSLWVGTSNAEDGGEPHPDDDRLIRLVFSAGGAGRS